MGGETVNALKILRPRSVAAGAYIAYTLMGVLFLITPSPGLNELLGHRGVLLWNGLLVVGGVISLIGAILKKYWMETIGLPGVIVGLGVYGLVLAITSPASDQPPIIIGLASVFLGASIGSLGRLIEVRRHIKLVERISRSMGDG